jgi:hypothetical protein
MAVVAVGLAVDSVVESVTVEVVLVLILHKKTNCGRG